MSRTIVILAHSADDPEPTDAEEKLWAKRRATKRITTFLISEALLLVLAVFGPIALAKMSVSSPGDLEHRVSLRRSEKVFAKDPADVDAATTYAYRLEVEGREEEAAAVREKHAKALAEQRAKAESYQVEKYRVLLKNAPCSKTYAIELGNALNAASDFRGALDFVQSFQKECGEYLRLLWVAEYAHRQLGDMEGAAQVCTPLIAAYPDDSDFWWWRARNYAELGRTALADSDYRHSMAAQPNKFAASRYGDLVKDTEPCEGAFALQYFAQHRPEQAGDWAAGRAADLYLKGNCAAWAGRGDTRIAVSTRAPVTEVRAKLNGKSAKLLLYNTGYVTVTRAFAERAGIVPDDEEITVFAAGELHPARRATASSMSVGKAHAKDVRVAVVDTLPGGADGLLGLSFLWRFSVERTERGLELRAPDGAF